MIFLYSAEGKSIWYEDTADIPLSLKQALNSDKQSHKLLMKVKGYCKEICDVCDLFDSNVAVLYKDLGLYFSAITLEPLTNATKSAEDNDDHEGVIMYLRECSQNYVTR